MLVLGSACGIPHDPEGTFDRVEGGTLRVGVTDNPPWVDLSGDTPSGIEVTLVEELAGALGADIEWREGPESELAEAMHLLEMDLLIGGLTSESSVAQQVTLTHPFYTSQIVIGVPDGMQPPEDIAGVEVGVEVDTVAAGLLYKSDAEVVEVVDITSFDGALAIENYFLNDLGLSDTGIRLEESDHVMAVTDGENAWLTYLERFLLDNEERVEELVAEADP